MWRNRFYLEFLFVSEGSSRGGLVLGIIVVILKLGFWFLVLVVMVGSTGGNSVYIRLLLYMFWG